MRMILAAAAAVALASPAFAQTTPEQWLGQAQQDIHSNNPGAAIAAVNNAEDGLLVNDPAALQDRSARFMTFDNPVLRKLGRARSDLQYGDTADASIEIGNAMIRPSIALAP